MKKITILAVAALILLIFINPSKINILNSSKSVTDNIKEISSIDFTGEIQYVEYKSKLCLLNDNKFKIIDEDGKEIYTQDMQSENTMISSNNYIDILNKNTNNGISINEDGKVVFSTKVSPETFLYKSINEDVFVNVFKSNEKEILRILNNDGEVNNKIEIDGKITNIKTIDKYILASYINITNELENKLILYDENGNVKKETKFNDIILDILKSDENIYVIFKKHIKILDNNLSEKDDITIEEIESIEVSDGKSILIKNSQGSLSYIQGDKYKNIKTKEDNLNIEGISDTYILYSNKAIYNDKQKQIMDFDEEIKDVKHIGKSSIAVIFKNNIKIFKVL